MGSERSKGCRIPIVVASSNQYLCYLIVMLWSVMLHGSKDGIYAFFIFHDDIPDERQCWFLEAVRCWENCEVTFLDIRPLERQYGGETGDWSEKRSCLSLFAVDALPQYDKAVFLDADLIVERDIAKLYETDLGDKLLAAVYDLDFIGQWSRGNRAYRRYYSETICLKAPMRYIQAGVMLVDLDKIRNNYPTGALVKIARENKFKYDDQDIWNLYFSDNIKQLDHRWNVLHDNDHCRIRYVIDFAPRNMVDEYMAARREPYIIHYAGCQKPWNDENCDLGAEYWAVAERTPVADVLRTEQENSAPNRCWRILRTCYHEVIRAADLLKGIRSE